MTKLDTLQDLMVVICCTIWSLVGILYLFNQFAEFIEYRRYLKRVEEPKNTPTPKEHIHE